MTTPHKSRFGWMTPRACAWREMVKQVVTVLNHSGAKITELNIRDILGPKWAWRMGKLFQAVWFVEDDWQDKTTREAIAAENHKVHVRWINSGGDLARQFWWHVTEITLDHLRPSPGWEKAFEELLLAKIFKQDDDKHRMLREALEDLVARDLCPF